MQNISVSNAATTAEVVKTVRDAEPASVLVAHTDRQYSLLKLVMVKLQRSDISVELHDAYGVAIRQVVAKKKVDAANIDASTEVAPDEAVPAFEQASSITPETSPEPEADSQDESVEVAAVSELSLNAEGVPVTDSDGSGGQAVPTGADTDTPEGPVAVPEGNDAVEIHPDIRAAQARAIRALEDAFKLCRASELSVVGFSDGLVAVPKAYDLTLELLSSTEAFDIDARDVYQGFEADDDDLPV